MASRRIATTAGGRCVGCLDKGGGPRLRVIRGGSWINDARNVRAAYRNHDHPSNRNDNRGFRLARAPEPAEPAPDPTAILSDPIQVGKKQVGAGV